MRTGLEPLTLGHGTKGLQDVALSLLSLSLSLSNVLSKFRNQLSLVRNDENTFKLHTSYELDEMFHEDFETS